MFSFNRKTKVPPATEPVRTVGTQQPAALQQQRPLAPPIDIRTASPSLKLAHMPLREVNPVPPNLAPAIAPEVSNNVPVSSTQDMSARSQNVEEEGYLSSLEAMEWRGVLSGLVNQANMPYCVVVDLAYSTVQIMATYQHQASGPYLTLITELQKRHYKIEKQVLGNVATIAKIYQLSAQKNRSLMASAQEDDDLRYARLYDDFMWGAYKLGASDVHFEIDHGHMSHVRLRIAGRMRLWKSYESEVLLKAVGAGFSSRTKKGTNSGGSFSSERAMSTITRLKKESVMIEGRFSSLPTNDGCDVVVRVIVTDPAKAAVKRSLEESGFAPSQVREMTLALKKNSGMILMSGGTGHGKSSTLKTMMGLLPHEAELKRTAVEDPSEYDMPGVRRFSIQRGPDDPEEVVRQKFMATLRQQMRMDPDVVMLGEIRDNESGSIALEFALTGHRVLTTVHGDGAIDTLARCAGQKIGIPVENLAMRKTVSISIFQRLVPKLCKCKIPATKVLERSLLHTIRVKYGLDPETMYCANQDGCPLCRMHNVVGGAGTVGLTMTSEAMTPTNAIRERIADRDWGGAEKFWRETRRTGFGDPDMTGKTAFEHALYKASIGVVDVQDIEADFESLESYEVFQLQMPN